MHTAAWCGFRPGRERVRLGVVRDVEPRHGDAGSCGEVAHDGVVLRRLLLGDLLRSGGGDGQLVAEPVGAADEHEGDDEPDDQALGAEERPHGQTQSTEPGQQDDGLEVVHHRSIVRDARGSRHIMGPPLLRVFFESRGCAGSKKGAPATVPEAGAARAISGQRGCAGSKKGAPATVPEAGAARAIETAFTRSSRSGCRCTERPRHGTCGRSWGHPRTPASGRIHSHATRPRCAS